MATHVKEITHPIIKDAKLIVLEKERHESGGIIILEVPAIHWYSAMELVDLGQWLVNQGKSIQKQYTVSGKRRPQSK